MIDFDSMLEEINDRSADMMREVNRLTDEASWAYSEYQDLLDALGATDFDSALEAIRELKAAGSSPVVVAPAVKLTDTDFNLKEVNEIILHRIALALSKGEDVTRDKSQRHHQQVPEKYFPEKYWDPTSRTIKTFRDVAGVN